MKAFSQIQLEIIDLNSRIILLKHQHAKLHQIDMLSSEGNKLREQINRFKGMRTALEWVIHDQINGDLHEQLERDISTNSAIREDAGDKDLP